MRVHTRTVISLETGEILEDDFFDYAGEVALAKGGGGDTTQNTTAKPPDFQIPFIQDVLNQAQTQFNEGPNEFFPGNTVADLTPEQQAGLANMFGSAAGQQTIANNAADATNFQLTSGVDPRTNPFFNQTMQDITDNATRGFQENLTSVDGGAIQAGAFGGSRQGVAQAQMADDSSRNLSQALTSFGSDAFNKGMDRQLKATVLAPGTMAGLAAPGQTQFGVGNVFQGLDQAKINEEIARFNFGQTADNAALQEYAGLVGNPLGTSQTTINQGGGQNPIVSGVGGAVSGGVLGGMAAGASNGAFTGPQGAMIGAGLGAALGLFGSG